MSEQRMPNSRQTAYKPFTVGDITVDPPLLLAPMEDVTNQPFRRIAKRIGRPGLMFTEFISAMAIHHGALKTRDKMQVADDERPLGIQIFGGVPDVMAETARVAVEMGADLVDINMGCWVPKVCRTGSGAALMKDPDLATQIVSAVVAAVSVPVTVKVRAGWDWSLFAAPDLCSRFQDAGAQMITLHARFAKQGFEGQADWKLIEQLRKAVDVPLIGNGDIKTPEDAAKMLDQTGCDGVMVGRAAISNPWRLAQIRTGLTGDSPPVEPSLEERTDVAIEHAKSMVAHRAGLGSYDDVLALPNAERTECELRGVRALRGQLPLYIKGVRGAAEIRGKLSRCSSIAEIEEILRSFALTVAAAGPAS
ncbi:MAG: tRNA dihydrouridine synthase DusB [Armatimonadetes bacterium]|nr:tRNA dihydrouridine synthase DusB [Armatimonadota bacterium]